MKLLLAALSNLVNRTAGTVLTGDIDHDGQDISEALKEITAYNMETEKACMMYEAQEQINKTKAKQLKKVVKAKVKQEMSNIDISDLDLKW